MNRLLLTLSIVFISVFVNAQFKKGDILLGGNLSFSTSTSSDTVKSNSGNFNISVGKAINQSSVLGINFIFQPTWGNNYYSFGLGPLNFNNYIYLVGIFYRKYKDLGKDFFLFGEGSASYGWTSQSGKDINDIKLVGGSGIYTQLNIMPGFAYRVSKKFFLELALQNLFYANYSSSKTTIQSTDYNKNHVFSIGTSLSSGLLSNIGVGFRLVL